MHQRSLRRASLAGRLLAGAVAFVLPVAADAPISGPDAQYDKFGSNNTTITDRFTKLNWSRPRENDDYLELGLQAAKDHCAGRTPRMRLPTLKELLTIVDEEPHAEYVVDRNRPRYIDRLAFSGTPEKAFWTSSKAPDGTFTYTVDFTRGTVSKADDATLLAVRCVR